MASKSLWRAADSIESGIHPSLPNQRPPLWADGSAVIFREGSVQPIPGQFLLVAKDSAAPVLGIVESCIEGENTLLWGTDVGLKKFVDGTTALVDVTRLSGPYTGIWTPAMDEKVSHWSFAIWGDWLAATNGKDKPQFIKVPTETEFQNMETPYPELATQGITAAEIVLKFKENLVFLNTANGGHVIEWCDTDDLAAWTPSATNTAGRLPVRSIDCPIVAAINWQTSVAFFGNDSMHALSFVGPPFHFGASRLLRGLGAVSKVAVVAVGNAIYGFGPRGFWRTDGFQVGYIDDPSVHDFVRANIDLDYISRSAVWHDVTEQTVVFLWPESATKMRSLGFCYANNTWSPYNIDRTVGTLGALFDYPITADSDGNIFAQSVTELPASEDSSPFRLLPGTALTAGFGELGFGEIGFGGTYSGDG